MILGLLAGVVLTLGAMLIVGWFGREPIKYWLYFKLAGSQEMNDWFSQVRNHADNALSMASYAYNKLKEQA